jgi:hypothetical protein
VKVVLTFERVENVGEVCYCYCSGGGEEAVGFAAAIILIALKSPQRLHQMDPTSGVAPVCSLL